MLTIINRKELCITRTIESQAEVRDVLQQNEIEYTFKIIDHNNYSNEFMMRASTHNREILYRFYVRKQDYERACYLIKNIKK